MQRVTNEFDRVTKVDQHDDDLMVASRDDVAGVSVDDHLYPTGRTTRWVVLNPTKYGIRDRLAKVYAVVTDHNRRNDHVTVEVHQEGDDGPVGRDRTYVVMHLRTTDADRLYEALGEALDK